MRRLITCIIQRARKGKNQKSLDKIELFILSKWIPSSTLLIIHLKNKKCLINFTNTQSKRITELTFLQKRLILKMEFPFIQKYPNHAVELNQVQQIFTNKKSWKKQSIVNLSLHSSLKLMSYPEKSSKTKLIKMCLRSFIKSILRKNKGLRKPNERSKKKNSQIHLFLLSFLTNRKW